MKESETPTLFDQDPAAIYDQYDKTFGTPQNAQHVGATLAESVLTASGGKPTTPTPYSSIAV